MDAVKDVAVIGGGAAGCVCAILCARAGLDTVLLEKNEKIGKKLYITGKGRCNLTADYPPQEFLNGVVRGAKFLRTALYSFSPDDTKAFFEELGVPLETQRGNRVFPVSEKSSDVIKALDGGLRGAGVDVRLNTDVRSLVRKGGAYEIAADRACVCARFAVVATGGLSYPSTGSTGDGYGIARAFGHSIVKPVPSLAQLIIAENVGELRGLSLKNIELSAYSADGRKLGAEFGEMLFTDKGLSGPVALTLSASLNRTSGAKAVLDLKPALDAEKLDARILRDFAERCNADLKNATRALLPERLNMYVLKRAGLRPDKKVNFVTRDERKRLVDTVKALTFNVKSVAPFTEAVVTSGGVELKELTPKCMSRLSDGLYFIGEVIDADAYTGGYNLQIAFSTAAVCAADIFARAVAHGA